MKRILSLFASLLVFLVWFSEGKAQVNIPDAGDPVCALCGVDLKSQVPHKKGCIYYEEPQEDQSYSSTTTTPRPSSQSSGPTPELPFKNGRCPECGRSVSGLSYVDLNGAHSGCRLGEAIAEYGRCQNALFKAKKRKADAAWRKMKDAEERILQVAGEALRRGYPVAQSQPSTYSSTSTPSTPSTHLRDYTPEPEHATTSEPLLQNPVVQQVPQFSGINESNITHADFVNFAGRHEWGEIDEEATIKYFNENFEGGPFTFEDLGYDIERYNHSGGPVVLGARKGDGRTMWIVFVRQPNGKYAPAINSLLNRHTEYVDNYGGKREAATIDVRYRGEGHFIVREYEGGYKRIFNARGDLITSGNEIYLADRSVDGKRMILLHHNDGYTFYNEDGRSVVSGVSIDRYDNALVVGNITKGEKRYSLCNWRGEKMELDGVGDFQKIQAKNFGGVFYVLKDEKRGYALISSDFKRIGGWYETELDADRAIRDYSERR